MVDLKGYKLVAVEWEDAHYNTEECEAEDVTHRPWIYISTGILIQSDEIGVTLATDIGEDGKFRGRNFVPRKMITREWVVGPMEKRVRRKKNVGVEKGVEQDAEQS